MREKLITQVAASLDRLVRSDELERLVKQITPHSTSLEIVTLIHTRVSELHMAATQAQEGKK